MSDKKPAIKGSAAVLDEAHLGDIKGAFGTIRQHDLDNRRTWGARLLTLSGHHGPGAHRHGGRQRRRRGVPPTPRRGRTTA